MLTIAPRRVVLLMLLAAVLIGSAALGAKRERSETIPSDARSFRLIAAVFEVTLDRPAVGLSEEPRLTEARSGAELLGLLAPWGEVRTLYELSHPAEVGEEPAAISVSRRVPMVRATRPTAPGQRVNAVEFREVGLFVEIARQAADRPGLTVQMELAEPIDLHAADGDSAVGPTPPGVRAIRATPIRIARFYRPEVAVTVDHAGPTPVALVSRIILLPPND